MEKELYLIVKTGYPLKTYEKAVADAEALARGGQPCYVVKAITRVEKAEPPIITTFLEDSK